MTDRLTLRVGIDGPTGGIQVSLSQLDEHGTGHGYRLAGPKFTGSGEVLVSRDLTEADAAEIRRYLDAVFPVTVSDEDKRWNEAVDWLLNSRHCGDPDIQEAFWGMVDGKYTREQADRGCLRWEADDDR